MKHGIIILVLTLCILSACGSSSSSNAPGPESTTENGENGLSDDPCLRLTEYGYVKGVRTKADTLAWLGIPYAKPPLNELRWKAPRDPEPWKGILKTDAFCSGCPQFGGYLTYMDPDTYGRLVGSENCLGLNIWRPASTAEKLPVFFWIHGGGNSIGEAGIGVYNGARLAQQAQVVVVTINYRLGYLGWFNHPALRSGDPLDDSGNFGTLDIIKALTWVRRNISHFGGDPENVTIAGQSAGAYNVYALLLSPLAQGLFRQAIAESGPQMTTTAVDTGRKTAADILNRLLIKDGYIPSADASATFLAQRDDAWIAAYLRSKSVQELYALFKPALGGGLGGLFPPFEDGAVIPKGGWRNFISGQYNQVPLIVGANKDEVKLFIPYIISEQDDAGLYDLAMTFDPDHPDLDILDVCTRMGINPLLIPLYEPLSRAASGIFQCLCVDVTAGLLARHQHDIYAYQFAWDEETPPFDLITGASHSIEVPFVFGNFDTDAGSKWRYAWSAANRAGRERLSKAMMAYWRAFMYTGNPNTPGLPEWLPWSEESAGARRLVLDTEIAMSPMSSDIEALQRELDALDCDGRGLLDKIMGAYDF